MCCGLWSFCCFLRFCYCVFFFFLFRGLAARIGNGKSLGFYSSTLLLLGSCLLFNFGPLPSLFVSWDDWSGFALLHNVSGNIVVCSVQWSSLSAGFCFSKCENCNHTAHFSMIDWLRTGIWRVLLKLKWSIFCSWILDSSMSCPCGSAFSSFSLYHSCHFLVFQGTPWLDDGWILWSQFVAMELLFSLVILSVPCKTVGGLEARATEAFCIYHNFVLEGINSRLCMHISLQCNNYTYKCFWIANLVYSEVSMLSTLEHWELLLF
jgi:hypothetical protein